LRKSILLKKIRAELQAGYFGCRTEKAYLGWINRYIPPLNQTVFSENEIMIEK